MLCIESINHSSSKFQILDYKEAGTSFILPDPSGCIRLEAIFERPHHFYYEDKAEKIRVIIGNDELVNTDLSPLKSVTNLITDRTTRKITTYECPWHLGQTVQEAKSCPLLFNLYKNTNDLSIYNGTSFKIFINDNLVRDYKLSFQEGNMKSQRSRTDLSTSVPNKQSTIPTKPVYKTTLFSQIFEYFTSFLSKFRY